MQQCTFQTFQGLQCQLHNATCPISLVESKNLAQHSLINERGLASTQASSHPCMVSSNRFLPPSLFRTKNGGKQMVHHSEECLVISGHNIYLNMLYVIVWSKRLAEKTGLSVWLSSTPSLRKSGRPGVQFFYFYTQQDKVLLLFVVTH